MTGLTSSLIWPLPIIYQVFWLLQGQSRRIKTGSIKLFLNLMAVDLFCISLLFLSSPLLIPSAACFSFFLHCVCAKQAYLKSAWRLVPFSFCSKNLGLLLRSSQLRFLYSWKGPLYRALINPMLAQFSVCSTVRVTATYHASWVKGDVNNIYNGTIGIKWNHLDWLYHKYGLPWKHSDLLCSQSQKCSQHFSCGS